MDFITIDFETATFQRDSACEIGLTFVEGNQIRETKSWLIRPPENRFYNFNISIHGITPDEVADKPGFDGIWEEIKPLVEGKFLIAHNAAFDFSVLRRSLERHQISFPKLSYSCSYIFSKKVWGGLPGYDLATLCKVNNIDLLHHRAGPDSKATAELALRAFEVTQITSIEEFPEKLQTRVGQLYNGGYDSSTSISQYKREYKPVDLSKFVGDSSKHNPDSIFYGKSVVFTGSLSSMVRSEAHQLIVDIGGTIADRVTKETDFLVVGQQDYRLVGDDGLSNKQEHAIRLIAKGAALEVIPESDFLANL